MKKELNKKLITLSNVYTPSNKTLPASTRRRVWAGRPALSGPKKINFCYGASGRD